MTPDLFGRPGSYPPPDAPARRVDNESQWRVSGWAVPLLGVVGFIVIVFCGG